MITFQIEVNGISLVTAGTDDLSVLVAAVTAVGKLGAESQGSFERETDYYVELNVSGLTSRLDPGQDEHMQWLHQYLKAGDVVTIKFVESSSADEPKSTSPAHREGDDKAQFEWAKKVYLENRDRFEDSEAL